jgi:alcohol dehydrogenase class IV
MQFEFATATRIRFGNGTIKGLPDAAAQLGKSVLFVLGESRERGSEQIDALRAAGLAVHEYHVRGEPTVEVVLSGLEEARGAGCDVVVGMGGGSVLDTGKAIAALMRNPGEILDYLEVVGKGLPLTSASAPCIAVPTTAGSGSEVTRNAVLMVRELRLKVSLRSPYLLPRLALVDPELTYSLPPAQTAASGMDALTQVIEPLLTRNPTPLTDAVCREGIVRVAGSLKRVYDDGDDREARENMSAGSLMGGMALANAKLGAVHGFAGALGGMYPAPHGGICARLLPGVMDANLRALRERGNHAQELVRFSEVARLLTGRPDASAEDGISWLEGLVAALDIPSLKTYGVKASELTEVIHRARQSSSMKGNPVELSNAELTGILEAAL